MKPSPVTEQDYVSGPANAPVTLIEYGDYECPFCVKAYPILEGIRQTFGDKLRFVYRHVPKAASGFAKQAAEASEFAASQGKFWAMHGQLFQSGGQHDFEQLLACAKAAGLDVESCRKALTERTFAARVRELAVASLHSGIIGTPTLFINGQHYENRIERPLLEQAVRAALEATVAT